MAKRKEIGQCKECISHRASERFSVYYACDNKAAQDNLYMKSMVMPTFGCIYWKEKKVKGDPDGK